MKKYEKRQQDEENSFQAGKQDSNLYELPQQIESLVPSATFPKKSAIKAPIAPIDGFFKKKEQQLQKKESNFSKILQSQQFQQINNDNNTSKSISKFSRFSKSSIKKKDEKESQLKGVIDQHKKMLSRLQTKIKSEQQLNQFQKNLLKQEKNRYLSKIQQLQAEIEQLYRDNYRLKQLQKIQKQKPTESFQAGNLNEKSTEENNYKPYVINTRKNDLNIINTKNYERSKDKQKPKQRQKQRQRQDILGNKLQKERPITAQEFFNKKPNHFGLYEQKFPSTKQVKAQQEYILKDLLGASFDDKDKHKPPSQKPISPALNQSNSHYKSFQSQNPKNISFQSINRGQHFDTFRMANSLSYVNDSAINESRQMVNMSSTTSTRNKVAFFKNSLVIVREPQIQIAYKRSQMNESLNKIRIIFYLNNKTNSKKKINFTYEYQHEYFQIEVIEKLTYIDSQTQGRQVIEVSLISTSDLNGVTDVHVQVDSKIYDFWLPANFIKFKQAKDYRMQNDEVQMNVLPDKQFSTFARMSEVASLMYGGRDEAEEWAYLYGESRFGNFTVKLSWRDKQVVIECTQRWIDFMGFLLHFFK